MNPDDIWSALVVGAACIGACRRVVQRMDYLSVWTFEVDVLRDWQVTLIGQVI
jgi:hypothetical protein